MKTYTLYETGNDIYDERIVNYISFESDKATLKSLKEAVTRIVELAKQIDSENIHLSVIILTQSGRIQLKDFGETVLRQHAKGLVTEHIDSRDSFKEDDSEYYFYFGVFNDEAKLDMFHIGVIRRDVTSIGVSDEEVMRMSMSLSTIANLRAYTDSSILIRVD